MKNKLLDKLFSNLVANRKLLTQDTGNKLVKNCLHSNPKKINRNRIREQDIMSQIRITFFGNPYQDYSPEICQDLIENQGLHPKNRVKTKINERWMDTLSKLENLSTNDNTVYTGSSGVALLKLKRAPNDKQNLKEVKQLLQLNKLRHRSVTFLCGDAGPLAISAIVNYRLQDQKAYEENISALYQMSEEVLDVNSDLPNEYLYGRAGYLYAIMFVNKEIPTSPFSDELIRKIIEVILICGKELSRAGNFKCPLMYQWHDSYYIGAAHGVSGILYLLLQLKNYITDEELNSLVKPTIDYLATLRFPSGNFPSSIGRESDKLVQWCHGAPGFVFLYSLAFRVFGNPKYLQLAVESGDVVWQRGLAKKGYSLCHGVSGNAYCFLDLFQTTNEDKYLYRAIRFAEWCLDYTMDHEEHFPDRPLSLYEGIAGSMYFLLDMQNPAQAKFPGFTL